MDTPTLIQIVHASALLSAVRAKEETRPSYDVLSDAIIWVDEVPAIDGRSEVRDTYSVLRPLWWHRTRLILGESDERYLHIWNAVRQHASDWPGFIPERCRPDAERVAMYRARVKQWNEDLENM